MDQQRPRRLIRWLMVILVGLIGVVAFAITQDWFAGTWPWGSHSPGQGTVKASKMKVTAGKMVVTEFGAIEFIKGKAAADQPDVLAALHVENHSDADLATLDYPAEPFGLWLENYFGTTGITAIRVLTPLTQLRALQIAGHVTEPAKRELGGLQQLRALSLAHTDMTDTDLKHLGGLKHLQSLDLARTKVTNAGLKELVGMERLRALGLTGTAVTDEGLQELAALKQLQGLNLGMTQVSDEGLKALAPLTQLRYLALGTKVTDTGLEHLLVFKELQTLDLVGTGITGDGLQSLQHLPRLQSLDVSGTPVTQEDVATLTKVLPKLKVQH